MSFVKEFRRTKDEFPEWNYLNNIGVRNMFGEPINNWTTELVVDRENNYYLISQGHTNPSRDDSYINYYALCIKGKVINMEVTRHVRGRASNSTYECEWIIEKIYFPDDWTFALIDRESLRKIIKEAFTVETFSRTVSFSNINSLKVDIIACF